MILIPPTFKLVEVKALIGDKLANVYELVDDPFDPRTWIEPIHECRVYGDDRAQTWAIVDEIDYQWAIQWKWSINSPHTTRKGTKEYFRRSQGGGGRYQPPLYLHVEIMKRAGVEPPSPAHNLVDHINGCEWDCRRSNLEWATTKGNRARIRPKRVKPPWK